MAAADYGEEIEGSSRALVYTGQERFCAQFTTLNKNMDEIL